jgi:NifU-like protein involved in Fe-S cluster formation
MNGYSPVVLEHFERPRHTDALERTDAVGVAGMPGDGPFLIICLCVEDGQVKDAAYQTFGCAPAIAAGNRLQLTESNSRPHPGPRRKRRRSWN